MIPHLFGLLLLTSCGGGAAPGRTTYAEAPATDRDPPAYAPPPGGVAQTGGAVGLAADAGYEPARAFGVTFFRALLDADRSALTSMLVDSVVIGRNARTSQLRAHFVEEVQRYRDTNPAPQQVTFDELVETQRVTVRSISAYATEAPWIENVGAFADTDLVVSVPIRLVGRRLFFPFVGRAGADLVIRPGLEPRVVGML